MLEASLNALHMALSSLGATPRHDVREANSNHAMEIGLIGASAELAMSACLVHAHGSSIQTWSSGQYKAFPAILDDFREMVREARPKSEFLVEGVDDPPGQRDSLIQCCVNFRILASARAGGFHAGRGPEREVAIFQGNCVADFLECLAGSSKIKPYLSRIPRCPFFDKDRMVIVEDLTRRLNEASSADQEALLSSVFLVLPDVPEDCPDWIDALDRVTIAPKDTDITYLLDVLDEATPATLRRTTRHGAALPVRVRQNDPDALPIATQYLRRQFNDRREQLNADIGTANGRLNDNFLDLPPAESVREMFAIGVREAGLLEQQRKLTAHESWPFVASSLSVQGTIGPYWFMVRETGDLGQLSAQLNRAVEAGGVRLERKADECFRGIEAIRSNQPLNANGENFQDVIEDIDKAEKIKAILEQNYERHEGTDKGLPEKHKERLKDVTQGSPVGPLLSLVVSDLDDTEASRYWSRVLSEAALDSDDLPALIEVLVSDELGSAHTAARKAIRRIDFRLHGPPIQPQTDE